MVPGSLINDMSDWRRDLLKSPHVPVRTCVSCGVKKFKADLVRVSIDIQGVVNIGPTNNQKGRGIYLCSSYLCWDPDSYKNGLEKGLRIAMSDEIKGTLFNYHQEKFVSPFGGAI